jgi:hypothetical protein
MVEMEDERKEASCKNFRKGSLEEVLALIKGSGVAKFDMKKGRGPELEPKDRGNKVAN